MTRLNIFIFYSQASLVAQLVKNLPACKRPQFHSWVQKIPWRRDRLLTPVFLGFPGGSDGKKFTFNAGDLVLIPGLGRFPGGGHGDPLQYSCMDNPNGQRSLVGYSSWGHKESDMTERLSAAQWDWRYWLTVDQTPSVLFHKGFGQYNPDVFESHSCYSGFVARSRGIHSRTANHGVYIPLHVVTVGTKEWILSHFRSLGRISGNFTW